MSRASGDSTFGNSNSHVRARSPAALLRDAVGQLPFPAVAKEAAMAQATATIAKPVWVDLSSSDPDGSRAFYSKVFGWEVDVNPDPQYGGYALAKIGGKDVAGIGPQQSPGPTAWSLYIGTQDAEELGRKV